MQSWNGWPVDGQAIDGFQTKQLELEAARTCSYVRSAATNRSWFIESLVS